MPVQTKFTRTREKGIRYVCIYLISIVCDRSLIIPPQRALSLKSAIVTTTGQVAGHATHATATGRQGGQSLSPLEARRPQLG